MLSKGRIFIRQSISAQFVALSVAPIAFKEPATIKATWVCLVTAGNQELVVWRFSQFSLVASCT